MDDAEFERRVRDAIELTERTDAKAEDLELHGVRESVQLHERCIKTAYYKAKSANAPIIFAFYGGGFVYGNYAAEDLMYDTLRNRLDMNVVSVNYRHATRAPFPAAVYDCYETALYYIKNSSHDFSRDRIYTFGSSAGANLAAAVSILSNRRREFRVAAQILNYPVTDVVEPDWAYKGTKPQLMNISRFYSRVYATPEQQLDPLASPVYAGENDFDRELVTILSVAEHDDLCHEAVIFANQLKSRGMRVYSMMAHGQYHGFFEQAFKIDAEMKCWPDEVKANALNGSMVNETERMLRLIEEHTKADGFVSK